MEALKAANEQALHRVADLVSDKPIPKPEVTPFVPSVPYVEPEPEPVTPGEVIERRLRKYADILSDNGMMPTAGIGAVHRKLRLFALQRGADKMQEQERWEEFFQFLDERLAVSASDLVKFIDTELKKK